LVLWSGKIPTVSAQQTVIPGRRLVKPSYCTGQVPNSVHLYRTIPVRSKVECLGHCQPDISCVSIVYENIDKLCHLGNTNATENCTNMESGGPGISFYQEVSLFVCLFLPYFFFFTTKAQACGAIGWISADLEGMRFDPHLGQSKMRLFSLSIIQRKDCSGGSELVSPYFSISLSAESPMVGADVKPQLSSLV
jgi:hypothetical protein